MARKNASTSPPATAAIDSLIARHPGRVRAARERAATFLADLGIVPPLTDDDLTQIEQAHRMRVHYEEMPFSLEDTGGGGVGFVNIRHPRRYQRWSRARLIARYLLGLRDLSFSWADGVSPAYDDYDAELLAGFLLLGNAPTGSNPHYLALENELPDYHVNRWLAISSGR